MNIPKKILVATDFNDLATAALRAAADLAGHTGGSIVLLYADTFEPPPEFTAPQLPDIAKSIAASRRRAKEELERCAGQQLPAEIPHEVVVVDALPVPAITAYAESHDIDLIAMGTHGRGAVRRMILGSVAEQVIRLTRIPVLTVHDASKAEPIRNVACTPAARDYAESIAASLGAAVQVMPSEMSESDTMAYDLIVLDRAAHGLMNIVRHGHAPVITLPAPGADLVSPGKEGAHVVPR
jgi:nucleotide-binding universal stress UspA family protein